MRAIYLDIDFSSQEYITLEKSESHHLVNVLRIKLNQSLLGLNGCGQSAELKVRTIKKKLIELEVITIKKHVRLHSIDLVIGKLKKDAMDLVLKQACEIGFRTIYIVDTEFSQRYDLNMDRLKKLLIAGIEQSNNPFLPTVQTCSLNELSDLDYDESVYFCVKDKTNDIKTITSSSKIAIIIGPEGGLSSDEELTLEKWNNINFVHFPSYILRAPTAVACASGHILSRLTNIDALK